MRLHHFIAATAPSCAASLSLHAQQLPAAHHHRTPVSGQGLPSRNGDLSRSPVTEPMAQCPRLYRRRGRPRIRSYFSFTASSRPMKRNLGNLGAGHPPRWFGMLSTSTTAAPGARPGDFSFNPLHRRHPICHRLSAPDAAHAKKKLRFRPPAYIVLIGQQHGAASWRGTFAGAQRPPRSKAVGP